MYSSNFILKNLPFFFNLAVFDPVSWLVIHYGITKLAAIAICAGVITVALITSAMIFDHIRKARQKRRDIMLAKIVKTRHEGKETIGMLSMNASGEVVSASFLQAQQLSPDVRKMANITLVNHT